MRTATYWRLLELAHLGLGQSRSDTIESLINDKADALGIPLISHREAEARLRTEYEQRRPPPAPASTHEPKQTVSSEEITSQHFTF